VLSNVYENGLACEPFRPNRRRALQVLLACSRGASNAELLLQIGRMYRSGYGNNSGRPDESDYMLAFRYTESAARENDVEPVLLMNIMSDLGVMYSEGRGTPSSFKRAAEAMKAACPRHLREFRENCKRVAPLFGMRVKLLFERMCCQLSELPVVPGILHRDLHFAEPPIVGIATDFHWAGDEKDWKYTVDFLPHKLLVPGVPSLLHPRFLGAAEET